MRKFLRSLASTAAALACVAGMSQTYGVYVFGEVGPCGPAVAGGTVTVTTGPGVTPSQSQIVTLSSGCHYNAYFDVDQSAGQFVVQGSCGNGLAAEASGVFESLSGPGFTTDLMINLECAPPSEYQVTVTGHVSPCALLDNTVTVRCTSCTPWVETSVPVDGNCDYSAVLTVADPQGTIVAATGCSNGLVPSNTIQYLIAPGQTSTQVPLFLSCDPGPSTACFTVTQTAPFTASFANCSTGCLPPFTFLWDFSGPGGGGVEGDAVEHTFPGPGTYVVCLNVTGADGCVGQSCQEVVVGDDGTINPTTEACHACAVLTQATDGNGVPLPFQLIVNSCSTGGDPWSHEIQFGDGETNIQTGGSMGPIGHIYPGAGIYNVCLTYENTTGCSDDTCLTAAFNDDGMLVTDPQPCQAGFWVVQGYSTDPVSGDPTPLPGVLWAWNLSSGTAGYEFLWSFGDGATSTEAFPTHEYEGNGPYTLCLTITGGGCTSTYCDEVSVDDDGIIREEIGFTLVVMHELPSGIAETSAVRDIKAWPNPTVDELNISVTSAVKGLVELTAMDLSGRTVLSQPRVLANGNNTLRLGTEAMEPGIYVVRVGNKAQGVSQRFVKTR